MQQIRNKHSNNIKEQFHSKPVYSEKYLKTERKFYESRTNPNFHDYGIPKEVSH